jgi:hypothetical protein
MSVHDVVTAQERSNEKCDISTGNVQTVVAETTSRFASFSLSAAATRLRSRRRH